MTVSSLARAVMGPRWVVRARCLAHGLPLPRWGNFRRVTPFSTCFGFDRGTPIDRYYVDQFFAEWRADITGDVLEVQLPGVTRRYGHELARTDTVDIDPGASPTYLCDLAASERVIPTDSYDCFILPNTLSLLRDLDGCLRQALRIVKPGGVILSTVAAIGQLDDGGIDYWRMTPHGWREVAARVWPGCEVSVHGYGNCLAATAAVQGLAAEELTAAELDVADTRHPVLVGIRCRKAKTLA